MPHTDDWVVWGGYDINLAGGEYAEDAGGDLAVFAYPAEWAGDLPPEPLHQFITTTEGESK
jgi:hypothetical protein